MTSGEKGMHRPADRRLIFLGHSLERFGDAASRGNPRSPIPLTFSSSDLAGKCNE